MPDKSCGLVTNGDERVVKESKIKIFFNRVRKWRRGITKRKENGREGRKKDEEGKSLT